MSDYFELSTEVAVPTPIRVPTAQFGDIIIAPPTRRQVREIQATGGDESNKALFGANYDALVAHFDDLPVQHWDSFIGDVSTHFFGPGADASPGKSQD